MPITNDQPIKSILCILKWSSFKVSTQILYYCKCNQLNVCGNLEKVRFTFCYPSDGKIHYKQYISHVSESKIEMLNWMHSTQFSDICTRGAAWLQTPDRVQWEWRQAAASRLRAVLLSWAGPGRAVCSVWLAAVSPLCKAPLVFSSPSTWLSHCNPVSLCQERHLLVTKFLTRGADIERDHNPFHFSLFFIPSPFHFWIPF